jgi:hypothetical protein
LGTGSDFLQVVASDFFVKLVERYGNLPLIPPEHIYFLSTSAFDYLMQAIRNGESIISILRDAVEKDREPHTKSFMFDQHVFRFKTSIPEYLDNEFRYLMQPLLDQFTGNKP